MAILIKNLKEQQLRMELLRKADDPQYSEEERRQFAEEAAKLEKQIQQYLQKQIKQQTEVLRMDEENQPTQPTQETQSTEGVPRMEVLLMNDWPRHAKLVKERVALIEDQLYETAKKLCLNDMKVLVSALGHALNRARNEKKETQKPQTISITEEPVPESQPTPEPEATE